MSAMHEDPARVHDQVWEDLSWYVNGTLDERSATRVQAHVRACAVCRQELAGQQLVKRAMVSHSALEYAPQSPFLKLLGRIEEREQRRRQWRRLVSWMDPRAPGRSPSARAKITVLLALSVQAVVVLLFLGWSGWLLLRPALPGAYMTLTTPPASDRSRLASRPVPGADSRAGSKLGSSAGTAGATMRVVFVESTPIGEMQAVLRAIEARIVDGPNGSGALTIEVFSAEDPVVQRSAVLEWLRDRPCVVLAEPVDAPIADMTP